ncbi:MAG: RNA degradosome polyphosphate kinase [Proteobacteria bacterium]|nr:RNA degradosome polyphosphate kinase [Pseudomonadota bacterium]
MNQNLINRELSWLSFNDRVLEESKDKSNPLFERVKFLSIAGTNLDEFFMVRVAGLFNQIKDNYDQLSSDGLTSEQQLKFVVLKTKELLKKQNEAYLELKMDLSNEKIFINKIKELDKKSIEYLNKYFTENIYPIITPTAIDPSHPFPFISNKGEAILMKFKVEKNDEPVNIIVAVPKNLPKFLSIPQANKISRYVLIEDVITAFIAEIFTDYKLISSIQFKIIRDSEIEIDDEAEDLVRYFEKALKKRRRGNIVKLEILANSDPVLVNFLIETLEVNKDHIYYVEGLVGIQNISQICERKDSNLTFKKFKPREVERLKEFDGKFFLAIKSKDFVVHHPFETFDVVIQFLQAAAKDSKVIAIKQTLYRTTPDSPIVNALILAAENGKVVTAVIEIKARFDEEANIELSRRLEKSGVQIVYGFAKYKTHAKASLVLRKEGKKIQTYVHLGTGNYHPINAKIYTDLSLFSADEKLTKDVEKFFNFVTAYAKPKKLEKIFLSPINSRKFFIDSINNEIQNVKSGKPAEIWAKMNSLVDPEIINHLYEASNAGIKINLSVRGVCCLRPGVKNLSENIMVKSIIGRFLEHSRIYCFANGYAMPSRENRIYLSSADLMPRNLDRRIELIIPIDNKTVHEQILDQIMLANFKDNSESWYLKSDGNYYKEKMETSFSAHSYFMQNPSLSGRGKSLFKLKPKNLKFAR